ncbi:MAG: hypothetical protein ACREOQ_08125 [Gemmatimonadales bacterium]
MVRPIDRWSLLGLWIAVAPLAACGRPSVAAESEPRAVKVEQIEGTDLNRLTLTEQAARRLDIQTAQVETELVAGTPRKVVAYAAILYDTDGDTWAYASPEPLTFVRAPVTVDYIERDVAVLSDGPPVGTTVVTVGAAELYGSEEEFEEE